MRVNKHLIFLIVFLFSAFWAYCGESVNMTIDKLQAETGEPIICSIEIVGDFADAKISVPEFDGFRVISRQQRQTYGIDNNPNLSVTLRITLVADEPGEYEIKPVKIEDKDNSYQSDGYTIIITGRSFREKQKILKYLQDADTI